MYGAALAIMIMLGLSACTTASQPDRAQYELLRTRLQEDPALRQAMFQDCTERMDAFALKEREMAAAVLQTDVGTFPSLFCRRLLDGFASGRVSIDDVKAMERGALATDPDVMRRVLPVMLGQEPPGI